MAGPSGETGRLHGRVALVTGASRGIGAAVCRAFASEGAAVAVGHMTDERGTREAVTLAAELGNAVAVGADVSSRAEVDAMVAAARERLGPIDILVVNAAASGRISWLDIGDAEWRRVLAANLDGALFCSQAVYSDMRDRGGGKIITVSSVMAELGVAGSLHYVTTKAGLIGFTRALAREVGGDGIRVNCVMPGAIRTEHEVELFPDRGDEFAETQAKLQSLPRRGFAEDLTGAFLFLACDESDFVTGQVITVDGGWVNY